MAQPLTYGAPISLAKARAASAAALKAAEAFGTAVVVVVDSGGHLVLLERMDGTQLGSIDVAIAKAKSSIAFKKDTRLFVENVQDAAARARFASIDGIMPVAGGVVLIIGGQIVGAIGVSGLAPEDDDTCALAGAKAAYAV